MKKNIINILNIMLFVMLILCLGITKVYADGDEIDWISYKDGYFKTQTDVDRFLATNDGVPKCENESPEQAAARADVVKQWKDMYTPEEGKDFMIYPQGGSGLLSSGMKVKVGKDGTLTAQGQKVEYRDNSYYINGKIFKAYNPYLDRIYKVGKDDTNTIDMYNKKLTNRSYNSNTTGDNYGSSEDEMQVDASGTAIYKNPEVIKSSSASDSLEDVINDADIFEKQANKEHVTSANLQDFSGIFFSILFQIGVAVAVIVGGVIGIKFMMSSVEEKASIKELLVPYIFGCVVVFGAFGIWKIAVNIFSNL